MCEIRFESNNVLLSNCQRLQRRGTRLWEAEQPSKCRDKKAVSFILARVQNYVCFIHTYTNIVFSEQALAFDDKTK